MLETLSSSDNAFVTLTYAEDQVPAGNTLIPQHCTNFLKRIRKAIAPRRIRYYLVGEYGDQTQRPHYHLALFNYPTCRFGRSQFRKLGSSCCVACDAIQTAWGHGLVLLGTLETHSAQYVAGYVTKKMTAKDDPRLEGRHPEFCRMSLRPGIGLNAMPLLAQTLQKFNLDASQADVPVSLRHGPKMLPLGRYLRRKLRTMIGKDEKAPLNIEQIKEMLPVYLASVKDKKNPSYKAHLLQKGHQASLNQAARFKLYRKGKTL